MSEDTKTGITILLFSIGGLVMFFGIIIPKSSYYDGLLILIGAFINSFTIVLVIKWFPDIVRKSNEQFRKENEN
jgi:hypothetical protein